MMSVPPAETGLPGEEAGETRGETVRHLLFDLRRDPASGGVLLVRSLETLAGLASDLRLTSQMRSVSQISPAVAHDLRAPINAMVFNIEVLKETIAAGRNLEPAMRDRQLRYVNVLHDELHRLHQGLETYIAQISPRGDRDEALDLRELLGELAALLIGPARKGQARIAADLPAAAVRVTANRYLLRQGLLHLTVAALATVPRDGELAIRLARGGGRARVSLGGGAGAATAADTPEGPGFGLAASARGTQAQLWAARAILADLGGEVRAVDTAGGPRAYEVELPLTEDPGLQEKE